jgi:hypothetical protein
VTDLEQYTPLSGFSGVRPLPGDQLTMPPQQGVRRGDRREFAQSRTAEPVRPGGQPPAIVVRETQAMATKLTPQEPVLFDQVRDRLALPTVQPASEHA